jgi:hypothetical protein
MPGAFAKAGESFLAESLAPFGDDLAGQVEPLGDLGIPKAFCGEEHDFGPDNIAIR